MYAGTMTMAEMTLMGDLGPFALFATYTWENSDLHNMNPKRKIAVDYLRIGVGVDPLAFE
jgi:hypothetical protein